MIKITTLKILKYTNWRQKIEFLYGFSLIRTNSKLFCLYKHQTFIRAEVKMFGFL